MTDAWLAALCITLAVGSKYLALPAAGIVLFIARATLWVIMVCVSAASVHSSAVVLIAGMSASVFWRNWRNFKNPLWPDLKYDNPARGIHLPSVTHENPFDMNMKVADLVATLLSVPYSVTGLGQKGHPPTTAPR